MYIFSIHFTIHLIVHFDDSFPIDHRFDIPIGTFAQFFIVANPFKKKEKRKKKEKKKKEKRASIAYDLY